jgi:hypothetical protein
MDISAAARATNLLFIVVSRVVESQRLVVAASIDSGPRAVKAPRVAE